MSHNFNSPNAPERLPDAAAHRQRQAVRRIGNGPHAALGLREMPQFLQTGARFRLQVPQRHGPIEAAGNQRMTVGMEGHGRHGILVAFAGRHERVALAEQVPEANGPIAAAGNQLAAVGRKGNAGDGHRDGHWAAGSVRPARHSTGTRRRRCRMRARFRPCCRTPAPAPDPAWTWIGLRTGWLSRDQTRTWPSALPVTSRPSPHRATAVIGVAWPPSSDCFASRLCGDQNLICTSSLAETSVLPSRSNAKARTAPAMALEDVHHFTAVGVPELNASLGVGGSQVLTVGRKEQGEHVGLVAFERGRDLAADPVPELEGALGPARSDQLAAGTDGHRGGRLDRSLHRRQLAARIPDIDLAVDRGGGQVVAVGGPAEEQRRFAKAGRPFPPPSAGPTGEQSRRRRS